MSKILAKVLVTILLLLVCGCTGLQRGEKASIGAGSGSESSPSSQSVASKDGPPTLCLERYGFAVYGFRAIRDNYNRVSVVGEVKNMGPASRGVELQASLRDATGHLVAVGHFCPASNQNIVPEETWPFSYSFGVQEDALEAELRIVGTFRTTDILSGPSISR